MGGHGGGGGMSVRIVLAGITGRMGREIAAAADDEPGIVIIGGTSRSGASLGDLIGDADVVIDMTRPSATVDHVVICAADGVPFVTGTTGLNLVERERLTSAANDIPVFAASNLSPGVAAIIRLLPALRLALDAYDVEIIETHHRHKADAPSGTAMALLDAVTRSTRDAAWDRVVYGRSGEAPRRTDEIGMHAVRAGGNPGEHTIVFANDGEEIRVSHRAFGRRSYALGAIRAATWLVGKPPGFYGMEDLLGNSAR